MQARFHNEGRPVIPWEEYLPFAPEEALDIDLTVPSTVRVSSDRDSSRQDRNYEPVSAWTSNINPKVMKTDR